MVDSSLPSTRACVWIVELSPLEDGSRDAWALLSPGERTRAGRFHRDEDRHRYVTSRAAMRQILAREIGAAAADLEIAATPSGKPCLPGSPMRFSLSRSGSRALVGLCRDEELGVDVEAMADDPSRLDIARALFSSEEIRWMDGEWGFEQLARFYRLWVMREALVKAIGTGLSHPMSGIALRVMDDSVQLHGEAGWRGCESPPIAGYAAAAVIAEGVEIAWRRISWSSLWDPNRGSESGFDAEKH